MRTTPARRANYSGTLTKPYVHIYGDNVYRLLGNNCGITAIDVTKEARNHNIVNIDIDILQYGDTRLHVDDWNRPYIATLLKQLNP